MAADPSRVTVTSDQSPQFRAAHQNFPELRSEGETAAMAATNLAHDLEREIDVAADEFHREPLWRALDDVRAFVAQI
jgi:hypothetical protein